MARCPPALAGASAHDLGIPAPGQLLDGRDVDRAVVEVLLDGGELGGQEPAIGPDRVPGQWHGPRPSARGTGCSPACRARLLEGDGGRGDLLQQAALRRACPGRSRPWPSSCSGVVDTTRSGPSATMARSSSVTRVATSTMTSRSDVEPGHLQVHPHQHAGDATGWQSESIMTVCQTPCGGRRTGGSAATLRRRDRFRHACAVGASVQARASGGARWSRHQRTASTVDRHDGDGPGDATVGPADRAGSPPRPRPPPARLRPPG